MTSTPAVGGSAGTAEGAGPARSALVTLAVGVVLADSSIVTLGLPDILQEFDASVMGVAWVLISFNLALALVALPAATVVRRRGPAGLWRAGILTFATASLACALAPSLEALIAARCVQAIGGAAVVAAALDLLVTGHGNERGGRLWAIAGIVGAAVGPGVGGALTQLVSWQSIFVVQVPLAALVLAAPAAGRHVRGAATRGKAPVATAVALTLVSAALTAALFLLVILLTEGWQQSPLRAALIVSVMPVAALAAGPLTRMVSGDLRLAAAGAVLLAGGLAALGVLPGSVAGWTVVPQILIGVGLGLALAGLISRALVGAGGGSLASGGAWVIVARHAGVVVGLLLLTPVFTADLKDEQVSAERAGAAVLLDAPLPPGIKLDLAKAVTERIKQSGGRLPDLQPAFDSLDPDPQDRAAYARLQTDLDDEIRASTTAAFHRSFLLAAVLALLALAPVAVAGRTLALGVPALTALVAAAGLVGGYLGLRGGPYQPRKASDPCEPRPWRNPQGADEIAQQVSISVLDGAACRMRVPREELALALATKDSRKAFQRERRINNALLADALRAGLRRAVADAERAKALSGLELSLARAAIDRLPVGALLDIARNGELQQALKGLLGG